MHRWCHCYLISALAWTQIAPIPDVQFIAPMLGHSIIHMVVGQYNFTFYIIYPYYQVTSIPSSCSFNIMFIH